MRVRKVVHFDEDLCNGCGLCVPSCAEGAIAIVDGKARLVSEVYCDGLGACLGECPQGAIRIDEREAVEFDVKKVEERMAGLKRPGENPAPADTPGTREDRGASPGDPLPCGCPSASVRTFEPSPAPAQPKTAPHAEAIDRQTALGHWPVKLALVPPTAPFLRGANLIVAADCAPFACPDFHESLLAGKAVVIGCPKLDDPQAHTRKLAAIFRESGVLSVQVVHMEVPCCFALVHIVRQAIKDAGHELPVSERVVSVRGEVGPEKPAGEGHDLLREQVAGASPRR